MNKKKLIPTIIILIVALTILFFLFTSVVSILSELRVPQDQEVEEAATSTSGRIEGEGIVCVDDVSVGRIESGKDIESVRDVCYYIENSDYNELCSTQADCSGQDLCGLKIADPEFNYYLVDGMTIEDTGRCFDLPNGGYFLGKVGEKWEVQLLLIDQ